MKNVFTKFFTGATLVALLPAMVNAETVVNNEEELLNALRNTSEAEIVLGSDIETTQKINITRDVTIDGQNHTIAYTGSFWKREGTSPNYTYTKVDDKTVWSMPEDGSGAAYVLQVYRASATIKNIALTGGNRGLAINGGQATLDGTIIFVDNGFQPIELNHGSSVPAEEVSTLKVSENTMIFNIDESLEETLYPYTLFVDDADGKLIQVNGKTETPTTLAKGENFTADDINVNIIYSVEDDSEVTSDIFEAIDNENRNLVLMKFDDDGNIAYGWAFEKDKLTDTSINVKTNITFTEVAPQDLQAGLNPFTKNLKDVNYLNFEHSGVLPGTASIYYYVGSQYIAGTKLYIAHYNETSNKLETPIEVTVDEDGYIEFEITECSSYVLYTETQENSNTTTPDTTTAEIKPAKTGDINILIIISTIVATIAGVIITSQKLATRK